MHARLFLGARRLSLSLPENALNVKVFAGTVALLVASGCAQDSGSGPAASPSPAATPRLGSVHSAPTPHRRVPAVSNPATAAPQRVVARVKPVLRPVGPEILALDVSPTVVGSGSTVSALVRTTPGVVRVVAYAAGTSMAVPRVGIGRFAGSTTLPPLPSFAHGTYPVTFRAFDANGRTTQSAVSVTVR
jgi:hypothetical protein